MNDYKENIDGQIEYNRSKNLFHKDFDKTMKFSESTVGMIQNLGQLTEDNLDFLLDYTTEQALQEFCRINQYFAFQEEEKCALRNIYRGLYQEVVKGKLPVDTISKTHYENLKDWIAGTNPFSQNIYPQKETVLEPVACSEYNTKLQTDILHLNKIVFSEGATSSRTLTGEVEPILDIGCGKEGNLVKEMRSIGIEAYGIDRFANKSPYLQKADWLDYDYGIEKWGTIVSNLGFSIHFIHHHLREDGNFIGYAKKYMDILNSLKTGGCFCYAPDLPFIEQYIDRKRFLIQKYDIENLSFKTTMIKRLN